MIFALGLPKTGTTSLAEALRILGYRVHHGAYDSWPALPPEVDAVVDTPFTTHWMYVLQKHAGSKIIITTRDFDSWLESCRKHMSRGTPAPHTAAWRQRISFLGTPEFNEALLTAMYTQHQITLLHHLRTMACVQHIGSGWTRLCDYLGHEVPDVDYPHLNAS